MDYGERSGAADRRDAADDHEISTAGINQRASVAERPRTPISICPGVGRPVRRNLPARDSLSGPEDSVVGSVGRRYTSCPIQDMDFVTLCNCMPPKGKGKPVLKSVQPVRLEKYEGLEVALFPMR